MEENETNEKVITPDDINNMTPEQFDEYLNNLDSGTEPELEEEIAEPITEDPVDEIVNEETPENAQEETAEPYKTYATEEEYKADVDRRINEAVENDRKSRQPDPTYQRLNDTARVYYKDAEDPLKAMADDMDAKAAELEGLSADEFNRRRNDARDAQAYRDMQSQAQKKQQAQQQLIDRWNNEAKLIKTLYPDFDVKASMADEGFKQDMISGKSMAEAYKSMLDRTAAQPEQKRTPVPQNVQSKRAGTGEASFNPASMTSQDFMKYINRIKEM